VHGWFSNEQRKGSRPRWSDRRERPHVVAKNKNGPHASDGEKRKSLRLPYLDRMHKCSSPDATARCLVRNREVQGCSRRDWTRPMSTDWTQLRV
jgi:hypothetical protein